LAFGRAIAFAATFLAVTFFAVVFACGCVWTRVGDPKGRCAFAGA
jgi:hypothetical protein